MAGSRRARLYGSELFGGLFFSLDFFGDLPGLQAGHPVNQVGDRAEDACRLLVLHHQFDQWCRRPDLEAWFQGRPGRAGASTFQLLLILWLGKPSASALVSGWQSLPAPFWPIRWSIRGRPPPFQPQPWQDCAMRSNAPSIENRLADDHRGLPEQWQTKWLTTQGETGCKKVEQNG